MSQMTKVCSDAPGGGQMGGGSARSSRCALGILTALVALLSLGTSSALAAATHRSGRPQDIPASLGSNVIVFTPTMPQAQIQAELTAIGNQQVPNQFGEQRYAIFFEPGTYGSSSDPLTFQVGYYEQVAGLGAAPGDVVINGSAQVNNQCTGTPGQPDFFCTGLDNFWRSLSNLTLNFVASPTTPAFYKNGEDARCQDSNPMWAVSQAAPMRRVIYNGQPFLFDYCGGPSYVSGGFFADNTFRGVPVNAGQQQFFTRNSTMPGWSNSVWNQVFMGDIGAPAQDFGGGTGNQYTTLPTSPVSEEQPFLYTDASGQWKVFVPSPRINSVGPDYTAGSAPGSSVSLDRFFVARPGTPAGRINEELAHGRNLIFTPGVYHLNQTIEIERPDTIVLGLGFATLIPGHGQVTMSTANVSGVKLSGLIFDAGPQDSPALLRVGDEHGSTRHSLRGHHAGLPVASDPTLLSDVFFRVGGAEAGRTTDALVVNTDQAILDDIWAWRADHGAGAGWTTNPADTGLVVNGNDVKAYGLAVEHFQKDEVIWNGERGEDVFFQNEMPYDPPSQAAWMSGPNSDGYPAFAVSPWVKAFSGYGMGSYSNFTQNVFADEAFASPTMPGVQWHDLLTVFLNGSGGIKSVIDGTGPESDKATQGHAEDVISYP